MSAPRSSFVDGLLELDAVQTRSRLAAAKREIEEHIRWTTGSALETLQAALAQVDADLLATARRAVETLDAALTASKPAPAPAPVVRPTLPAGGRPFTPRLPPGPAAAAPDPAPRTGGLGGIKRSVAEADPPAAPEPAEAKVPAPTQATQTWSPISLPPIRRDAPRPLAPIGPVADDMDIPF